MTEGHPRRPSRRDSEAVPHDLHGDVRAPSTAERLAGFLDRLTPFLLVACAIASAALFILRPVENGRAWSLAPKMTMYLIGIWFVYRRRPRWFTRERWLLGSVLVAGIAVAIAQITRVNSDGEVIHVYRAVFEALDKGVNPYDCGCIPHQIESGAWRLGNFNYPPTEIWPYYLAYRVIGTWNRLVFSAVLVTLGVGACAMLRWSFPRTPVRVLACYFPILVFYGLDTNAATAMFMVALVVLILRRTNATSVGPEALLALVFSVGLLTKFVVIPVFAAFYWGRVHVHDAPRSMLRPVLGVFAVLALAAAQMAPFGVANVLRETLVFNLALDTRAELTTYYPNVLSGVFYGLSLERLYPITAVAVLGTAVLVAPLLRTFSGILAAVMTFMFVAATPELQYLPIVLLLALAGAMAASEPDQPGDLAPASSGVRPAPR